MISVKTMPASEKLDHVLENSDIYETFLPEFLARHVDDQAMLELRQRWNQGLRQIPPGAPVEDQYEIAYANWIWKAQTNMKFIREKLGEAGIPLFEQAMAAALQRQNGGPALWLLRLVRLVAPGTAFKMTAQNFAYLLQWLTPFSVVQLSNKEFIAQITHCKILDYTGHEDVCQIGCQQIYPEWLRQQFKVAMSYQRKDHACTCLMKPLN